MKAQLTPTMVQVATALAVASTDGSINTKLAGGGTHRCTGWMIERMHTATTSRRMATMAVVVGKRPADLMGVGGLDSIPLRVVGIGNLTSPMPQGVRSGASCSSSDSKAVAEENTKTPQENGGIQHMYALKYY